MSTLERLAQQIDAISTEAGGRVGVVARHLPTGRQVTRRAEEVFPSASVIKLPLLVAAFAAVAEGRTEWETRFIVRPEDVVEGSGVLREMHAGLSVTLQDLARLAIVVSDNTAANMLMEAVGIASVAKCLSGLGFRSTRLERKFYDFAARDAGLENVCAAGELADLLERLERGQVLSPDASREMLAILCRQAYSERLPAMLPAGTPVAHKTGTITGVCHDAGILYGPAGPIVVVALTQGCRDPLAAETAIRRLARAAYDAFSVREEEGGPYCG
jgi:beta-lactamase class A